MELSHEAERRSAETGEVGGRGAELTANSFSVYSTDLSPWLQMLLRGGVLRHNENRTRVDTRREKTLLVYLVCECL